MIDWHFVAGRLRICELGPFYSISKRSFRGKTISEEKSVSTKGYRIGFSINSLMLGLLFAYTLLGLFTANKEGLFALALANVAAIAFYLSTNDQLKRGVPWPFCVWFDFCIMGGGIVKFFENQSGEVEIVSFIILLAVWMVIGIIPYLAVKLFSWIRAGS